MPVVATMNASVRIVGECEGDAVVSTLYYHVQDASIDAGAALIALVAAVKSVVGPAWVALLPSQYRMVKMEVSAWDENWAPVTSTPYIDPVGADGDVDAEQIDGAGRTMTIYFGLTVPGQLVPAGHESLVRSYLAYGPIYSNNINDDGSINTSTLGSTALTTLKTALITVHDLDTETWYPVRWGAEVGNDGKHTVSYISGVGVRPYASFRRSRMNRR